MGNALGNMNVPPLTPIRLYGDPMTVAARAAARVQPNAYDAMLLDEKQLWEWTERHGGTHRCCNVSGIKYDISPYTVMPPNGRTFQPVGSVLFSSLVADTDTAVVSIKVPVGYDGILIKVTNLFTGTFAEGAGTDLVWRVKVGVRYAKNLGNILTTYGSLQNGPLALPGSGIQLVSGQTVTYYVQAPTGSGANPTSARVICELYGWFWPRR